jgi:general secretion pathway protein E
VSDFLSSLIDRSLLSPEQAQRLSRGGLADGVSLVRRLQQSGYVDQLALASELSRHFGVRQIEETEWPPGEVLPDRISRRFIREHHVLPLSANDHSIVVAVSDPTDENVLGAIRIASERDVEVRLATDNQIMSRIEHLLEQKTNGHDRSAPAVNGSISDEDEAQLKDLALDAPVIDLVNRLFREASAARATDLHIEPARGKVLVRRRIDGLLQEAASLPPELGRAAVSRIKILTGLNIAERRLPQDGRARVKAGDREHDIRVATMPTIHGEAVAIRFLHATNQTPGIDTLGLAPRQLQILKKQAEHDNGMIVVTGPTGSGKTTTLAAVLDFLNDPQLKLITIEDPVEYQIAGVNQVQIRPDIGLTFAATLRSLLRFDPDIIMVGEMRDSETAKIGVNAALTGHLVLTTLHTNSAAGAITRLLDLGVQAFLIASTLRCVVAQRLVRRLCHTCREPHDVSEELIRQIPVEAARRHKGPAQMWRPKGCEHCGGSGFLGRAAIFEILEIDEDVRRLIKPDISSDIIARQAIANGMVTMLGDGFAKCLEGVTTIEEIGRVTSED